MVDNFAGVDFGTKIAYIQAETEAGLKRDASYIVIGDCYETPR
jgi:hypothetical protein